MSAGLKRTTAASSARARFLAGIPEAVRSHLSQWPERFKTVSPSIVISPARKATCLLDALLRLDMWMPDYDFASSLILDMPLGSLEGKRVLLADDAVFSGRTIRNAAGLLQEAGASEVLLAPLAMSTECPDLGIEIVGAPLLLDQDALAALSIRFVEALGLLPRPYNIDWPLTRELSLPKSDLAAANCLPGWHCSALGSRQQRNVGVMTYTLHPDAITVQRALADFPEAIRASLVLPKVRLYASEAADRPELDLTVLAVAFIPELQRSELRAATEWLAVASDEADLTRTFVDDRAALRLVQFCVGTRLLAAWADVVGERLGGQRLAFELDRRQLRYAFSPSAVLDVARVLNHLSEGPTADQNEAHYLAPAAGLDSVDRARLDEVDEREAIRLRADGRLAMMAKTDDARMVAAPPFDLGFGLTLIELLPELYDSASPRSRLSASLYLDSAIDSGTAVPSTWSSETDIGRRLRPGETVRLTERVFRYAEVLIRGYVEASGRTVIPKIALQKLLVLLLRVGDARGYFPPNAGPYGANGTIGVRFALHGAVLSVAESSPFGRTDRTIADELLDAGVITEGRRGYALATGGDVFPHGSGDREGEVQAIGALLGEMHSASKDRTLSDWDLVVLATLPSSLDQGYALAAEVDLICRGLPTFLAGAGRQPASTQLSLMRNKTWHTAINNASKKSECIVTREFQRVAERAASGLGPVHRGVWQGLVDSISLSGTDKSGDGYLRRCVRWIAAVFAYLEIREAALAAADVLQMSATDRRNYLRDLADRRNRVALLLQSLDVERRADTSARWAAVNTIRAHADDFSAVDLTPQANSNTDAPVVAWARARSHQARRPQ